MTDNNANKRTSEHTNNQNIMINKTHEQTYTQNMRTDKHAHNEYAKEDATCQQTKTIRTKKNKQETNTNKQTRQTT